MNSHKMKLLADDLIFVIDILGDFSLVFREIIGYRGYFFDYFSADPFRVELYLHSKQIDQLFASPQRLILLIVDYDIVEVVVNYDDVVVFSEDRYQTMQMILLTDDYYDRFIFFVLY